jgi:hypothetical protein
MEELFKDIKKEFEMGSTVFNGIIKNKEFSIVMNINCEDMISLNYDNKAHNLILLRDAISNVAESNVNSYEKYQKIVFNVKNYNDVYKNVEAFFYNIYNM